MKLPFKFVITLLFSAMALLVIYTVVVMNTTGSALKDVINRDDRNILENITREVDEYFASGEHDPDAVRMAERIRPLIAAGKFNRDADILLVDDQGAVFSFMEEKHLTPLTAAERALLTKQAKGGAFIEKGVLTLTALSREPGWIVVFRQPAGSAYAMVTKLQIVFGVLLPSVFCALLVLTLWLARRRSRSVESIIAGMETVAGGNMEFKIPTETAGELSRVVTIFNDMTSRLIALREEMKKKERLSTIGQMANILGHEIRNPLSAISGSVFLIKRQITRIPGSEALLKPIDIIQKEIASTNKIINDMLDFSRQRPPVLSERDLCEVVRGIMDETPVPENVAVNVTAAQVPKVWIDSEEIKQVIRNMVNNAVDSMAGKPGASLKIGIEKCTLTRSAGPVEGVALAITDTGCGMPPEIAARIFEPFYSTKSKGTGLGLAVVRRIVEERHDGVIEVKSVVGQGTTILVKLPVKKPA